jgi:hypothetical protein
MRPQPERTTEATSFLRIESSRVFECIFSILILFTDSPMPQRQPFFICHGSPETPRKMSSRRHSEILSTNDRASKRPKRNHHLFIRSFSRLNPQPKRFHAKTTCPQEESERRTGGPSGNFTGNDVPRLTGHIYGKLPQMGSFRNWTFSPLNKNCLAKLHDVGRDEVIFRSNNALR